MKSQTKVVLFCGLATLVSSLCVAGPIFEERGTLMVGAQVQQCLLVGDAPPINDFDSGTGFAMRLRYYLGDNRALGISLESQIFDGVRAPVNDDQPKRLTDAIIMADYLFYFDRESSLSRYVAVGLGLHHPGREYKSYGEVGPDGLAASLGGGLEYFFHRSTSVDVSVRGYGLFGQGEGFLGSVEAAVGMNFYVMN